MTQNEQDSAQIPGDPSVPATRNDYLGDGLSEADLAPTPFQQFRLWVDQAIELSAQRPDLYEPTAMTVATVDADGAPNVRTVLMRFLDERGPGFVTNIYSTKGIEIKGNPKVALGLTWPALFRAVRIRGTASLIEHELVQDYFNSRPYGSRLSAWASEQSQWASGRTQLEEAWDSVLKRFPEQGDGTVPVPPFWGGYRVAVEEIEFWAGRENRLHDRIVFRRVGEGSFDDASAWAHVRLQP